jgi:DNA-directed RNA polymerase subunit RPC12/RpoP
MSTFRKRYLGLYSVEYECQKCNVHFIVVYPDEDQVVKKVKCPLPDCGGEAPAFAWDEDLERLFADVPAEDAKTENE